MARRSQRSETSIEISVGIGIVETSTLFMVSLPGFEDEMGGFPYLQDAAIRDWYPPANFQTPYNPFPPWKSRP